MVMTKIIYQQFANAAAEIHNPEDREQFIFRCVRIFADDNPKFSESIFRDWVNRKVIGQSLKGLRPNPKVN